MSGFARLARRRSAFTLVELLVVIGIIALLVAILLPALSAARKQAAAVKCAAHLRDIGNAFAMYSIDNKGYFPVVQHDSYRVGDREVVGTGSNAAFWWDFLAKYVTKTKMGAVTSNVQDTNDQRKSVFWGCPAWDGWVSGSIIVINRVMTGYGMNWDVKVTPSYPPFGTYTEVTLMPPQVADTARASGSGNPGAPARPGTTSSNPTLDRIATPFHCTSPCKASS